MSISRQTHLEAARRIKPSRSPPRAGKKRIQSTYNQLSNNYWKLYRVEQEEKHKVALKRLKISRASTILDIGCGNGALAHQARRQARFVVGIDLSIRMTRLAKQTCRKDSNCEVVLADAENLPFRDKCFSILLAVTVILDTRTVKPLLGEMKRILTNAGLAVLTSVKKSLVSYETQAEIVQALRGWNLRRIPAGRDVGFLAHRARL